MCKCLFCEGYILGKRKTWRVGVCERVQKRNCRVMLESERASSFRRRPGGMRMGTTSKAKRKYHFPYLHVFQIIQSRGKYYIIVNNQSIINHEGTATVADKAEHSTYSAAENHKQHRKWDEKRRMKRRTQEKKEEKLQEHEKELFIWAFAVCCWLCMARSKRSVVEYFSRNLSFFMQRTKIIEMPHKWETNTREIECVELEDGSWVASMRLRLLRQFKWLAIVAFYWQGPR